MRNKKIVMKNSTSQERINIFIKALSEGYMRNIGK